jgi:hypothetical protein
LRSHPSQETYFLLEGRRRFMRLKVCYLEVGLFRTSRASKKRLVGNRRAWLFLGVVWPPPKPKPLFFFFSLAPKLKHFFFLFSLAFWGGWTTPWAVRVVRPPLDCQWGGPATSLTKMGWSGQPILAKEPPLYFLFLFLLIFLIVLVF